MIHPAKRKRSDDQRARDNARRRPTIKREPVAFDWDDAIVRLRAMLDQIEESK